MIVPLLAIGGLLFLLTRKRAPVLGAPGSNSSFFRGPSSGLTYPIAIGQPAPDGRRVHSVFNAQNKLLFVFVQDAQGKSRSLGAQTSEPALQSQVKVALKDFGFTK